MAEYIERRKVIFPLYRWKNIIKNTYGENDEYVRCLIEAIEKIEDVPSADVQPVRHGRWIEDSDGLTICSECEEVALQRVFIKLPEKIVDLQMRKSHYCPNCGCKMDGGDSNER